MFCGFEEIVFRSPKIWQRTDSRVLSPRTSKGCDLQVKGQIQPQTRKMRIRQRHLLKTLILKQRSLPSLNFELHIRGHARGICWKHFFQRKGLYHNQLSTLFKPHIGIRTVQKVVILQLQIMLSTITLLIMLPKFSNHC